MDKGAEYYRRFLAGERETIYDIIQDYRNGLILFIYKIVNDFCTAEELADDVFIKLCTDKPKFSGKSSFKTWLYTIGKNGARNSIKKRLRHPEDSLEDFYDISDKDNIEENYIRSEEKKRLLKAMDKLKDDYRQVLYLSYFEEFSIAEMKKIMGKSEKQISNLLYNAKKALKKEMEKEEDKHEEI